MFIAVFSLVYYIFSTVTLAVADVCLNSFDVSNRTIIKSRESIARGAKYLYSVKVADGSACATTCCKDEQCNVVIFRNEVVYMCYLFNCGELNDFKCTFAVHDNFIAMGMTVEKSLLKRYLSEEQVKHDMELKSLEAPSRLFSPGSNPKAPFSHHNRFNGSAARPSKAVGDGSSSLVLQPTMNLRPSDCGEYQWPCEKVSECVATYDRCDGIPQCSDGSDEWNCDSDVSDTGLNAKPLVRNHLPPDGVKARIYVENNKGADFQTKYDRVTDVADSATIVPSMKSLHKHGEHWRGRNDVDPYDDSVRDHWLNDGESISQSLQTTGHGLSVVTAQMPLIPVTHRPVHMQIIATLMGVVVALTSVLLIYVGCRMRQGRRRLRKGRLLNADEGEYLIHGMLI